MPSLDTQFNRWYKASQDKLSPPQAHDEFEDMKLAYMAGYNLRNNQLKTLKKQKSKIKKTKRRNK